MRLAGLGPVGYMTGGKLLVGLLGVALAFAPRVIYPFYAHQPHYWGLTPLEDQMMAGLVMALEQSIVMGIALVMLFVQMLNESEREPSSGPSASRSPSPHPSTRRGFWGRAAPGIRGATYPIRTGYAVPGTPSEARPGLRVGQLHFWVPGTVPDCD